MGRPVRNVHIGVKFTPFSPEALPRENQWDLIRHPLFHIYWTECLVSINNQYIFRLLQIDLNSFNTSINVILYDIVLGCRCVQNQYKG